MRDVRIGLLLCLFLAGCSIDPGATWAPDVLKAKAPVVAAVEQSPDMRTMLQTRFSEFFLPSAAASNVSFSTPHRASIGWTVCVKATVNGAAGGSIGEQTFLISIERNKPTRNENVGSSHWCHQEQYERL
jgi:hypothetical protein